MADALVSPNVLRPSMEDAVDGAMHRWLQARALARSARDETLTPDARVDAAIRRACIRSAGLGVASGVVSTAAAAFVVETGGVGALVAVPAAALAATAEVLGRAMVHAEMVATIARASGIDPDTIDAHVLTAMQPDTDARTRLTRSMLRAGGREALEGATAAAKAQGSMALRSMVPVVGVVTSAVLAWREARTLGRAVHAALATRPREGQ